MRKNLKDARQAKGLTQAQVAHCLGIEPNAYQKIEYGTRGTSIERWDKLEDLLGVSQRVLRELIAEV